MIITPFRQNEKTFLSSKGTVLHVYLLSQAEDLAHAGHTGSGSSNSENTRFGSRNKMTWFGFMGLKCMDTVPILDQ
jgi:hypothetical protein